MEAGQGCLEEAARTFSLPAMTVNSRTEAEAKKQPLPASARPGILHLETGMSAQLCPLSLRVSLQRAMPFLNNLTDVAHQLN
jgi:hypothetical protein